MLDPDPTTVNCKTRAYRIDAKKVGDLADFVLGRLGVGGAELAVTLVGSSRIRQLNREFRGIDKSTDVLSFPQQEWRAPLRAMARPTTRRKIDVLGDVVISLPDAERNARRIGQPLDREVGFLLVHGILHLCGHDHMVPADERRMRTEQRALMAALARGKSARWAKTVTKRRPA